MHGVSDLAHPLGRRTDLSDTAAHWCGGDGGWCRARYQGRGAGTPYRGPGGNTPILLSMGNNHTAYGRRSAAGCGWVVDAVRRHCGSVVTGHGVSGRWCCEGSHACAHWGVVRSGFVQIGGTWVVGVAGRAHDNTQTLDGSGTLQRVNPHNGYVFGAEREAKPVIFVG